VSTTQQQYSPLGENRELGMVFGGRFFVFQNFEIRFVAVVVVREGWGC
jgi:hypothetical protein